MTLQRVLLYLHSRNVITAAALLLLLVMADAWLAGAVTPIDGDRGLLFMSANNWLNPGVVSTVVNVVLLYLISLFAQALNKNFNIMRSQTGQWGALFLIMSSALVNVTDQFNGSSLLALILLTITWLLYSCYDSPERTRRIFLMFFLLSAGATFQYAFLLYIPVVALGMVQMKIMKLRSAIAAAIGLITPPWIILGFGIIDIDTISWPRLITTWTATISTEMILTILTMGLLALLGIGFFMANVFKLLSYNARYRAANGFQTLLLVSTIIFALVDYTNLAIYATLLALEASYQVAHFFSVHRQPRSVYVLASIYAVFLIFAVSTIMA